MSGSADLIRAMLSRKFVWGWSVYEEGEGHGELLVTKADAFAFIAKNYTEDGYESGEVAALPIIVPIDGEEAPVSLITADELEALGPCPGLVARAHAEPVTGERATKSDAVDRMHPAECALRLLLVVVDSEARVERTKESGYYGMIRGARPTHVVLGTENVIIGRGMNEIGAIMDAIETAYRRERDRHQDIRTKMDAAKSALRGLLGDP